MDLIGKMFESIAYGIGNLIGQGLGAAGDKVGASLPAGRPMDRLHTRRRLKGDEKELYGLYKQLERHRPNAKNWVAQFCRGCVITAIDPTPEELESPIIQAAQQLCLNILHFERYFPLPEIDFNRQLSLGEIWDETKLIRRCLLFYETHKRQGEIKEVLVDYLTALVKEGLPKLPPIDSGERWGETPVLNMH
jgi:hypothetical protein